MIEEEGARRARLAKARELGVEPYPTTTNRTHQISQVIDLFDELDKSQESFTIVGRIKMIRKHGGLTFVILEDGGDKIQVVIKKDQVGAENYQRFGELFDVGDFLEATGRTFITKTEEKSVLTDDFRMLTKSLLPLPEKWHGLTDIETRYRQRYLDLIANPSVVGTFKKRSAIINALRDLMHEAGFMEVETPILQPIAGGASAKPFITHHNALDVDLYLRIAPELYLKRLIVGGYEQVFEIGRQFRNEGIDWQHNPEFTSCEFYWAYKDYNELMDFTESLLSEIVKRVNGSMVVKYKDAEIDFTPSWKRLKFKDAVKKNSGLDIDKLSDKQLIKEMQKLKIDSDYKAGRGKLLDDLYKDVVRAKITQPTIIYDYPLEMEPLAKKCSDNPNYVERFQPIVYGMELVKAYSELNDPIDQLERFEEQESLREAGDEEAQFIDTDFVNALKHGMPPTAGWGMGIDRFVAILTNQPNLKEVILFPTLRPESDSDGREAELSEE